ncbi:MAG: potassium transporter TrkA [Bacteroidetes bacterium]|nr:potassium transporter TrkA [Bacteroidota bacterium]
MANFWNIVIIITGFIIILVASNQIAGLFQKIKLPLVTGLLVMGIFSGPYILNLIPDKAIPKLQFINNIALAFIAFAAGAELYIKELRSSFNSIKWMTIGQLAVTFILTSLVVFLLTDLIPFINEMNTYGRVAVSILIGTIFVARSPATAIAIINELRAKGPFTRTFLGVTVLIDFLVIFLFALTFSIANVLLTESGFNIQYFIILVAEFLVSFGIAYLLGRMLELILSLRINTTPKAIMILFTGYCVYLLSHLFRFFGEKYFHLNFYIEPLLICIIASFIVTNYTKFRREFLKIIHDLIPLVYIAFFTLIGASISLEVVATAWFISLILFLIRIITMWFGAYFGGALAGESFRNCTIGWMPYVTQAGVSLGLVTVVSAEFSGWGTEFATIMITVIVLNQLIGPPLLKWSIGLAGEDHSMAHKNKLEGIIRAIIFGYEDQSVALARQLSEHDWQVKIATSRTGIKDPQIPGVEIIYSPEISLEELKKLDTKNTKTIVTLRTDEENLKICELVYENYGTHDLVVRLNHRYNFSKFHELGAIIVEPSTAMVSLLDHFVRSPLATSLLLGMEENQDTVDIVLRNRDLHGIAIRDLHLPSDILILSTQRRGHMIISTGYTRLRLGDILTIVGSVESIEQVRLRFE